MKVNEFLERLKSVASKHKTVYMWGSFGQPLKEGFIQQKAKQYQSYYTGGRQSFLRSLLGKGYFAFDCVGLIKGILWGWTADASKPRGGAGYAINGVPDIDANRLIRMCKDVSTDFSTIIPGEVVWLTGHVGIYIGDGLVIEATPGWTNGVQITNCANIRSVPGGKNRRWTSHGKLPWVDYTKEEPDWKKAIRENMDKPEGWIKRIESLMAKQEDPLDRWWPDFISKLWR